MCGILAEYHPGGHVEEHALRRALAALRHRGPDGEGTWVADDGTVGLAHARLAILDLAGGRQPIANEDGRIVVIVNGEFYDHERIRHDLEQRGHRFRTHSDSELAVHLYEQYGLAFVHHLRGEFALVLHDARLRRLVAVRDRFGIKPLCWHRTGNRLLLASEAKALFALGVLPAWDERAFFQIASMQYPLPDQTLFADVHQLRPGQMLVSDERGMELTTYWDMDYPREGEKLGETDLETLTDALRSTLEESVRLRLRADVPVAFHLSGGLDSSTIVALASRHLPRPPSCFTVGFDAAEYDELELARQTATSLGVDFRPVPLGQGELFDHLAEAVWFSEGLAINTHLSAKFLLAREIRRAGFPVVLSGEGADEILAGYAHLRQDLWRAEPHRVARLAVNSTMVAGMHLPEGDTLPLEAVSQGLGFVPTFLAAKASLGRRVHRLLRDEFRQWFVARDAQAEFLDAFDVERQLSGRHPVDQASYLWSKSALATYILRTLGDGTEMAHAVEGRLPFLDTVLFELVREFPTEVKIHGEIEKWILRKAVADVVPAPVVRRTKQPFTAPPGSVFGFGRGREYLGELQAMAGNSPFFDPGRIRQVIESLPNLEPRERVAWDPPLMLAVTACLAQERFGV